jgi:hypothetical protein
VRWLCRLGLHKWGKWSEPFRAGATTYKERRCQLCNAWDAAKRVKRPKGVSELGEPR